MPELSKTAARPDADIRTTGRWRQLTLLTGTMLVDGAETGLVSSLFPMIRQSLGVSLGALGVLSAAGKLVGVLTGPFWVWAAQHWSRKGVLVLATGFWGAWGVAAGFSQSFTQLLLLYTALAAGYAAAGPIITEVIGDLFDSSSRGRATGLVYGAITLVGAALSPLVGQLAGIADGWRWALWSIGGFNILLGLGILLWFRDPAAAAPSRSWPASTGARANRARRSPGPRRPPS